MVFPDPPTDAQIIITETNKFHQTWVLWFAKIYRILAGKEPIQLASYTVLSLPPAEPAGQFIYVSNESGGAQTAFSDGTNWRRSTDRNVVS